MKNSLRTLYVSDLDGTLLNTDSRISKRTSEIITGLTDRGALITVATARTPATVVPLMSHTRTSVPAIVMTGAATWCRKSNRFITTHIMSHKDAAHISQTMAGCGISPFFYTLPQHKRHDYCPALEVYHNAYRPTHAEQKFIEERIDMPLKRFYLNTPLPENAADRIMLIFGMAPIERIKEAEMLLKASTPCYVSAYCDIFDSSTGLIEVYAPGVSKASAVKSLAEQTKAERIVAFGDNLNDLPMLEAADLAVAVSNARPEVKDKADIIIDANHTDAVARFIAEDFG